MRPKFYMPNPAEWATVIASRRKALIEAEDAYSEFLDTPVDRGNRRLLVESIAADVRLYEREGTLGDEDQDAAIARVIASHAALKQAERDARQGRLFPEGKPKDRRPMLDLTEVERANVSLARAEELFQRASRERVAERERKLTELRSRRDESERVANFARHVGVLRFSEGRYVLGNTSHTLADWILILMDDRELRLALQRDALAAQQAQRADMQAREEQRKSEARKAKAAAAKQPLPKGYTVEKGRGGYQVVTPSGSVLRKIPTKGEAVSAAIRDYESRKKR